MKKTKALHFFFYFLVPFLIAYYVVSKLRNKDACCLECAECEEESCCSGEVDDLSQRQQKIMEYIEKNGSGRVNDMLKKFPNVVDRTLRRDLNKLESLGLVERSGSTKAVVYTMK